MIKTDCHLHSGFSSDSPSKMEEMIGEGIRLGLQQMCFTEHMDFDFPKQPGDAEDLFFLDTPAYREAYLDKRERYKDRVRLLFGAELGLQSHLADVCSRYTASWPFDFVIGSSHLCGGEDPYLPSFFEHRTTEEACSFYFESVLKIIRTFDCFDVYGHLDYVVRYGPDKGKTYSPLLYRELFDAILKELIQRGKGIELNTSGWKYGLSHPHPHAEIVKRYRELGGEIITVGSDAHVPEHICYDFKRAEELLRECGFSYYTVFHERKPRFLKF